MDRSGATLVSFGSCAFHASRVMQLMLPRNEKCATMFRSIR